MVSKEKYTQANLAASQDKKLALYQLCHDEKDRTCVDVEVRCGSRVPHGSLAFSCQVADGQAVVQEGKEDDQQTVRSVTLK